MQENIHWLMNGPSWIQYRCSKDLLDLPENDPQVQAARKQMLADAQVLDLIEGLRDWESTPLKRHNDAVHPLHKLVFLADLGLKAEDAEMQPHLTRILSHRSEDGLLQILSNYPVTFGGSGQDEWLWCACDAPSTLYTLQRMGLGDDPRVAAGIQFLAGLGRENGWPCKADRQLAKFKGPGKSSDPCPYANLIILKMLADHPGTEYQANIQAGLESALMLWENSHSQRPFLFRMGTDFQKLKVPFIWYDLLHLTETLSHYSQVHNDSRFLEMVTLLESKQDPQGKFTSESIWTKWKGWEFCQKREPSRWVTLCALRILKRVGRWPQNP